MAQEEKLKSWDFGVVIPLLSIFSIAGIYYHELAFYDRLGLSRDFLRVEIQNNVDSIFSFLVCAVIFGGFWLFIHAAIAEYFGAIRQKFRDGIATKRDKLFLNLFLFLGCVVVITLIFLSNDSTFPLVTIVIFATVFSLLLHESFIAMFEGLSGKLMYHFKQGCQMLVVVSVTCLLMYWRSYVYDFQNSFCVTKNSAILIRNYQSEIIKGLVDSNRNIKLLIVITPFDRDTIDFTSAKSVKADRF